MRNELWIHMRSSYEISTRSFPWIWCKCLQSSFIHSKIFNLTKYREVLLEIFTAHYSCMNADLNLTLVTGGAGKRLTCLDCNINFIEKSSNLLFWWYWTYNVTVGQAFLLSLTSFRIAVDKDLLLQFYFKLLLDERQWPYTCKLCYLMWRRWLYYFCGSQL